VPELVDAIRANAAPQLIIGGTADEFWDTSVAHGLASETCTAVEIAEADHIMVRPGDVVRGVEAHVEVVRAIDHWLASGVVPRA
jgi:hypothetical protein